MNPTAGDSQRTGQDIRDSEAESPTDETGPVADPTESADAADGVMLPPRWRKALRPILVLFAVFAFAVVGGLYAMYSIQTGADLAIVESGEARIVRIGALRAAHEVDSLFSDVRLLGHSSLLQRWLSETKSVFLADDDTQVLRSLDIRLKQLGLEVESATDGLVALVKIMRNQPDLLILDVDMPGADGLRLCERLRAKQCLAPAIIYTGNPDEAIIGRCAELNARYVPKGSTTWQGRQRVIAELLDSELRPSAMPAPAGSAPAAAAATAGAAPKVLAVDDDRRITQALAIRLRRLGIEVLTASNGLEGFYLALKEHPDVIISDYFMPGSGGDYFIHRLRSAPTTRSVPVIVLTGGRTLDGAKDYALAREMRGRCEAVAFLTKPLDFDLLVVELRRHIAVAEPAQGS